MAPRPLSGTRPSGGESPDGAGWTHPERQRGKDGSGWIGGLAGAHQAERTSLMFGLGMNNNGSGLVLASTTMADHPQRPLDHRRLQPRATSRRRNRRSLGGEATRGRVSTAAGRSIVTSLGIRRDVILNASCTEPRRDLRDGASAPVNQ